jgi:ABC-type transport system substrate-binding protein
VKELVWAAALARDNQLRNVHPSLSGTSGPPGEATLADYNSAEIPRAENRWVGTNRGAWSNPEFDRFAAAYHATLDRAERIRQLVPMARIFSEDVAVLSLYFNPTTTALVSGLTGPAPVVPTSDVIWNVETWEFR